MFWYVTDRVDKCLCWSVRTYSMGDIKSDGLCNNQGFSGWQGEVRSGQVKWAEELRTVWRTGTPFNRKKRKMHLGCDLTKPCINISAMAVLNSGPIQKMPLSRDTEVILLKWSLSALLHCSTLCCNVDCVSLQNCGITYNCIVTNNVRRAVLLHSALLGHARF